MPLTGKQKKFLKRLGQPMQAGVVVGRAGLTDALLDEVRRRLAEQELLKVRLSEDSTGKDRKQRAAQLSAAVDAECVGLVGRMVLLYKANPDLSAPLELDG